MEPPARVMVPRDMFMAVPLVLVIESALVPTASVGVPVPLSVRELMLPGGTSIVTV